MSLRYIFGGRDEAEKDAEQEASMNAMQVKQDQNYLLASSPSTLLSWFFS